MIKTAFDTATHRVHRQRDWTIIVCLALTKIMLSNTFSKLQRLEQ